jgi:hypothetical protein
VLFYVMPSFAQTAEQEQETTVVTETAETAEKMDVATGLPEELRLTDEQVLQVEKIFKMAQGQAEKDVESFKGNALGLIEAARRRLRMIDYHIENLLNPEQKIVYAAHKKNRSRHEEFFILTEGLLLTEDQQVKVRIILDEYHEKLKSQRDKMRKQGGMRGGMRGGMSGGMEGGRGSGRGMAGGPPGGGMGRGGMGGGMRGPGSDMMDVFKKYDSKKAKKINKVLTEEQQKMYKAIRKMQKKEMQERLQEQRKKTRR